VIDFLHLDVETRSTVALKLAGPWVYAQHASTDLWCACWAIGAGAIQTWRPGDPPPTELVEHVAAGHPVVAHNAMSFERVIWRHVLAARYGWPEPTLEQWHCTGALAAAMALPRSLDEAARALGLPAQKDIAGHRLMLQMARPRLIEPDNSIVWWDVPGKVARLIAYCRQDVEVERALHRRLRFLSDAEREVFLLDARINERGVAVDLELVEAAEALVAETQAQLDAEMRRLTGGVVEAATQSGRLLRWLRARGVEADSVDKPAVAELLGTDLPDDVRRVLEVRAEAARSSTAKLKAFRARTCRDGRLRDNLLYHGAGTGRWSGRGVQLQNLPRPSIIVDTEAAITALKREEPWWIDAFHGPPMGVVSDCLRGMLIASPGTELIAADFAAIEARALAWLAGQRDLIRLFATGSDVYRQMAAEVYGRSVDAIAKGSFERQLGKQAVLGCGYGLGAPKFRTTCAKAGIPIDEALAERVVKTYRTTNDRIVALWRELDDAALRAVEQPGLTVPAAAGRVRFRINNDFLWLILPSGRPLAYAKPRIKDVETPWGELRPQATYLGVNSVTRAWERQRAYGGKWTENVVQAVARDLLAAAMLRLEQAGYRIVLSVHDELVAEVPAGAGSLQEFEATMCQLPDWANGCPVAAEGWRGLRYRK
jgi:DNA polymerase bacteriophage-type